MRGIAAAVWGLVICLVTIAVVGLCAQVKFPAGSAENYIMRGAGALIGIGLGVNAYRRSAKPPTPPTPLTPPSQS